MLNLVQSILPRGPYEWDHVTTLFNQHYNSDWQVDRIKAKFTQLVKARKPTGDPTCPPAVKRAKRLRVMIEERVCSEVTQMDDDGDEKGCDENESLGESGRADSSIPRSALLELSLDSCNSSTSSALSDSSSSSPSSSSSSSPALFKRKRMDVDGISSVIKEAVLSQNKSTEVMAQAMVQNGEMIRLLSQLLMKRGE
jgi:hypothetical protein